MINSLKQEGGDSSTNLQAHQITVNYGIDEKRAREICQEMHLQLRREYSLEALDIAKARVAEFESNLMSKMTQVEGALQAFADPGFQLLLVEAQKAAAASERPADHEILSELLVHRFQHGENRTTRAGVSFAVEIVDKISDEALLCLTVAHAINSLSPASGHMHEGLDTLNDLFGKLLYGPLPSDQSWLDHLDILNAVRLGHIGGLKKVRQYYSEILHGYVDVGILKSSESCQKALEILKANNMPMDTLVVHALNADYLRLPVNGVNGIDNIRLVHSIISEGTSHRVASKLSHEQVKALESIYALYSTDGGVKERNIDLFMAAWDERPNLKIVRKWWDGLTGVFTVTSVGKVLAHANAQRLDSSIPPLN